MATTDRSGDTERRAQDALTRSVGKRLEAPTQRKGLWSRLFRRTRAAA
jgi:hypothetical protein